jgi:Thiol:disulfide interchange protein DsbD, N-terminal
MPIRFAVSLFICGAIVDPGAAQPKRPRVELTTAIAPAPAGENASVRLLLNVRLPADVHVQSDKPRDPSLVPTVLTVKPPEGLELDRIVYPRAVDLVQAARDKPLAVFGSEFTIEVHVSLAPGAPRGEFNVPAELRYQACDAAVCYPPAKAQVQWTLKLEKS